MSKLYPTSPKILLAPALLPWVLSVGLSLTGLAPALAQTRPQAAPTDGLARLPAVAPPRVVPEGTALALQTSQQWAGHEVAAADLRISNSYTDAQGLTYTYVQQLHAGIPVYNQLVTLVFKDGKLRHHAGTFVSERAFAGVSATPAITAAAATAQAVTPLATGRLAAPVATGRDAGPEQRQTFAVASVSRRELATNLVWVLDAQQRPHLAWNVNVELLASPDWLNIRIDAATGQKLDQDNWTVHEAPAAGRAAAPNRALHAPAQPAARSQSQPAAPLSTQTVTSASYRVVPFPGERPDVTTPTIDTNPWLRAGAGNAATTYGWHFDGTTNYLDTRGNNVWAYDDSLKLNAPGRFTASTGTSSALLFDDVPDFTQTPTLGRNRRAATTNLFYWNNLMHDVLYQYGFTEATGNFQTDNQGRGGRGGDYVRAEAQDGSGLNNANFATPPDGTSGRMQMYLYAAPTKVNVTAPANAVAAYSALEGDMSTNNKLAKVGTITGTLAFFNDAGTNPATHYACGASASSMAGKIALISGYNCTSYAVKVKNAQTAGASGVIVMQVPGSPIWIMGGSDNTITIPAVMISNADAATLINRIGSGLVVSIPPGGYLDGDFDSGIMSHEYGHGISNRLTGGGSNTSCLQNAEQAGEGWSDYFALMMTTDWTTAQTTDGTKSRASAAYASGQGATGVGIRRYPYSTNMSVNPLTYADMATNTEVHATGEIWCATVWDMTWNIIQMQGTIEPNLYNSASSGGNAVALNLVMQGLKLQPCSPGFLDGRDAILAADSLLYGGRYHCAIWSAFARRGMGYSAKEGSSNSATDQTAAYDVPGVRLTKSATPLVGNQFALNLTATCDCATTQQPYTLSDQLPTDLQYVSSTAGGTLSGSTVTFSNLTFTQGQQRTFSILAQTAPGKGCAVVLPVNDDRDANQVGGLTAAVLTGSGGWAPSTARAHGGTTSWNAPDPSATSNVTLTSAAFTPGSEAVLSFYHYYNIEPQYDGGMVAISVNGGAWTDAAAYFLQNGYNSTFASGTVSAGKPCFSGVSKGFGQVLVNLSSFSGQSIRIRFQFQSDSYNDYGPLEGWFVDDIQVLSGCGDFQRITLKASGGTVVDSYAQNVFLTAPALALTAITPNPGGLGQAITITGTGLGSPTALSINGANALAGILSNDGSTLVVRVPVTAAAAGTVSITTAGGTATQPFSVMAAPGNALAFDGVDDYVRPAGTLPATGEFTLEAWVNPSALSNPYSALVLADDFPAGAMQCQFYGNQLGFSLNGNSPTDMVSTVALPLGRWAHVAVVYSASAKTVQFYLNGALVTTGTYTTAGAISATAYSVGAWLTGGTVQRAFTGRLDELRLYSVALTQAQVQADMLSTAPAVPASLALSLNFDQGTPATASTGANTGLTTLYDLSSNAYAATLNNFALSSGNPGSNYVASYALVVPTATAATSRLGTSFIATWTAPANGLVTSYLLDVSTTPDFSTPVAGSPFTAVAPAASYGVTGLTQSTTYYYRVRALNSSLTDQGAYSNSISVATPLSVTLLSFSAQAEGPAAVRLRWATASELNSQAFEVERSADGVAFATIGTVAAAGTTTTAHTYALLDATLPAGASALYYRLRQVDRDGTASYSPVRVVALAAGTAALYVYPNPATGAATLVGAETGASVQLLDALGRVVATTSADAAGRAFLPSGLPAGVYIVRSGTRAVRWSVQ